MAANPNPSTLAQPTGPCRDSALELRTVAPWTVDCCPWTVGRGLWCCPTQSRLVTPSNAKSRLKTNSFLPFDPGRGHPVLTPSVLRLSGIVPAALSRTSMRSALTL